MQVDDVAVDQTIHNVDTLHTDKTTWVSRAVLRQDTQALQRLLDLGANTNCNSLVYDADRRVWRWESSLMTAARLGYEDVVQLLVDHGASLRDRDTSTLRTALHWACTRKHTDIVKFLVSAGSSVNTMNIDGETPVVEVLVHRNNDLVVFFVEHGLSLDIPINYDRDTVLLLAVHIRLIPAAKVLLQAGSRVDWLNRDNEDVLLVLLRDDMMTDSDEDFLHLLYMVLYSGTKPRALHWGISRSRGKDIQQILNDFFKNPMSLMAICRASIRKCVLLHTDSRPLFSPVNSLQVPEYLKRYIKYQII